MNIPGKEAECGEILDRVIDLEPKNGKAHRWTSSGISQTKGRSEGRGSARPTQCRSSFPFSAAIRYEDEELELLLACRAL